jgi:hypothetical protein
LVEDYAVTNLDSHPHETILACGLDDSCALIRYYRTSSYNSAKKKRKLIFEELSRTQTDFATTDRYQVSESNRE